MLTTIKVDADRKTLPKVAYKESSTGELVFNFGDPSKIYHISKLCVIHTLPPNAIPYTRRVGISCKQLISGDNSSQFILHDKELFTYLSSDYNNVENKTYNITFSDGLDDDFSPLYGDSYSITTDLGNISLIGGTYLETIFSEIRYLDYEDENNTMSGLLYYIEEDL